VAPRGAGRQWRLEGQRDEVTRGGAEQGRPVWGRLGGDSTQRLLAVASPCGGRAVAAKGSDSGGTRAAEVI
jgi:hypothetical protein